MAVNFDKVVKLIKNNKYIFTIAVIKRAKELFNFYPSPQKSPVSFIEVASKEIEDKKIEITEE